MMRLVSPRDLLAALILLLLPLILFAPITFGSATLIPADILYTFEPYTSFADDIGVDRPQNHLLADLILENYIWKGFIREAIERRELPLWNPYLFSGQPFLANGQHSALYPFTALFYILPLSKAYGWFTLLHFWLAGLFTYIFLRVLGIDRGGSLFGGIVYSLSAFFVTRVVFTMVIAGAVWLPLILAVIEVVIRKQAQKGPVPYSPMPYLVVGAGAMGMQVLAGHVEITYYVLLVSAFYAGARLLLLWRDQAQLTPAFRLGLWLSLMMMLGLGLGAIQFIPFYEIGMANFREGSNTLAQVRSYALPVRRAISFVVPHFFGSPAHQQYFDLVTRSWIDFGLNANGEINPLCPYCATWDIKTAVEAGAYLGLLPLALSLYSVFWAFMALRRRAAGSEQHLARTVIIFAILAGLALLFAFGTIFYGLLYYTLPGWNQLHSPFRWIYPFTLAIAVLSSLGFSQLRRGRFGLAMGHLMLWPGLAALFGSGLIFLQPTWFIPLAQAVVDRSGLAQNAFPDGRAFLSYQWPQILHFALALGLSGLAILFMQANRLRWRQWGSGLAITIVAMDLLTAGWNFNPRNDPALLSFTPPAVTWLREQQAKDPFFRLTSFDTQTGRGNKVLNANTAMLARLYDVRGYDSVIIKEYHRFMQLIQPNNDGLYNRVGPVYAPGYAALDSALLDLLGVRYVLTTETIPNNGYNRVYSEEVNIYENEDAMPRAFLVDQVIRAPADLSLALRSLNPRETLILDGAQLNPGADLGTDAAADNPPEQAAVRITRYQFNTVELEVDTPKPQWLVLADTYFPGWRVYVRPQGSNSQAEVEVTLHRANGTFRAISLPPGQWQVRFYYAPMSFRLGIYTSFLAGVMVIFLLAYWSWGRLYREQENDSRIKRIAKNSLVPMVLALGNRLIDFAFALLMLRILQPEGAGRYAFAVAFISMAEIITRYGLGTLVTRDVAGDLGRSNRYLANVSILRVYLWLAALPFMATILAMYVIFGQTTSDVVITVAIFTLGTLFSNFSDGLTAIFYAHEKAEYPAAIASITTLTRVSLGALVLLLGWGIIGLAGASLVANLVAFSVLGWILARKILRPKYEHDPVLQRHMLAESLPLMINHMLSTIFFRIDVFILKPTWGDSTVGYYNAAYKYVDGINVIPQYFTLAIFPLMSKFAADSRESLIRAYRLSLRLLLILALPIAAGTPFVAEPLIYFLAGDRFIPDSVIVLQILIWFLPFSFINQVTQYVLIAINQQRALTRAFVIGVTFNLVTNLIFIPQYGYRAAAITTILSEWALLIPFYRLIHQHLCPINWFDTVWRPALAAGVMALSLWLLNTSGFLLNVGVGAGVYGLVLLASGGLQQQDMAVIWRALPVDKLRRR